MVDLAEDEVWALGLSFSQSVAIYQRRHGPMIIANESELPRELEEHGCRWIISRQVPVKRQFEYAYSANAMWAYKR